MEEGFVYTLFFHWIGNLLRRSASWVRDILVLFLHLSRLPWGIGEQQDWGNETRGPCSGEDRMDHRLARPLRCPHRISFFLIAITGRQLPKKPNRKKKSFHDDDDDNTFNNTPSFRRPYLDCFSFVSGSNQRNERTRRGRGKGRKKLDFFWFCQGSCMVFRC